MPVPHSQISRAAPADCLPPSTRRGTSGGRLEEASGAPGTPDKNAQLAVSEKKVLTVAGVFDLFSDLADDVSISFGRIVYPTLNNLFILPVYLIFSAGDRASSHVRHIYL